MAYEYKREPLTQDEANRIASACELFEEKLVVWTLLDTGLRISELAGLKKTNLDWQAHRIMVYGKGGPCGTRTKRRVLPLSPRTQPLIEGHFALHESFAMSPRNIQRLLKRVANRASISRPVSPHVLRHIFALTAVQKGISLPALQRLLGHDHLTTTEIYLNLSPEDVAREFQSKW
ncbi:tyrosine-type recombinase/integrase [Acidobacteria bacterium AH-259-O06]|nr:tyrosine-type recombinase/integrase [Acidobacteria bacterium AH-259-O06]